MTDFRKILRILLISKSTYAHTCIEVYHTHRMPPTCVGHSCGHLQGGALQRIDTWKHYKYYRSFEPMHRYFDVSILSRALSNILYVLYMNHHRWCNTQTYSEVYDHTKEWVMCDWKLRYTFVSVHWFSNFCTVSMCLSFVKHLKMATWGAETCRRYTVSVIYTHTFMCICFYIISNCSVNGLHHLKIAKNIFQTPYCFDTEVWKFPIYSPLM
jgi:hypothetical protein